MRIRGIPLLVLAGLAATVQAQEDRSSLHLGFVHFESVFKDDGFAPCAVRLSYERGLGQGLMFGIDTHVLWRGLLDQDALTSGNEVLTYAGWESSYTKNKREWGMNYRTGYFLVGNEEGGVYLGSIIGFRYVTSELIIGDQYGTANAVGPSPFRTSYVAEKIVFPVGIRLGVRGGYVYGLESDIYFGLAYQLGGGTNLFDEPELATAPTLLVPVTYTMGFAWMIGL